MAAEADIIDASRSAGAYDFIMAVQAGQNSLQLTVRGAVYLEWIGSERTDSCVREIQASQGIHVNGFTSTDSRQQIRVNGFTSTD